MEVKIENKDLKSVDYSIYKNMTNLSQMINDIKIFTKKLHEVNLLNNDSDIINNDSNKIQKKIIEEHISNKHIIENIEIDKNNIKRLEFLDTRSNLKSNNSFYSNLSDLMLNNKINDLNSNMKNENSLNNTNNLMKNYYLNKNLIKIIKCKPSKAKYIHFNIKKENKSIIELNNNRTNLIIKNKSENLNELNNILTGNIQYNHIQNYNLNNSMEIENKINLSNRYLIKSDVFSNQSELNSFENHDNKENFDIVGEHTFDSNIKFPNKKYGKKNKLYTNTLSIKEIIDSNIDEDDYNLNENFLQNINEEMNTNYVKVSETLNKYDEVNNCEELNSQKNIYKLNKENEIELINIINEVIIYIYRYISF